MRGLSFNDVFKRNKKKQPFSKKQVKKLEANDQIVKPKMSRANDLGDVIREEDKMDARLQGFKDKKPQYRNFPFQQQVGRK